jgi:hypothetical protein
MEFPRAHWHCLLPLAAIVIGVFLLRKSDTGEKDE